MNKVALITGSSRGIGAAIAKHLSQQNLKVIIHSTHSPEQGQKLAATLPNAIYLQAEITEAEQCQTLIDKIIQKFGRLDVLVNNAAYKPVFIDFQDIDTLNDELFIENFNVNVLAAWRLAKIACPHLKKCGSGNIINISSVAGLRPIGASIAYAVSKAALNHLTISLAKAMAPEIRVNAIAPGIMNTERVQTDAASELRQRFIEHTLLKRIGEPEEIAMVVSYLLECNYITGQVITVDGGTIYF